MSEIVMIFPPPSSVLLQQARADAPRGKLWTWFISSNTETLDREDEITPAVALPDRSDEH